MGEGRDAEKEVWEQSRGLKKWVREGGMQRERRNCRWIRHQNTALGLTLGIVLPALTPIVLSLAGAHELVRMDR